jgi:hypothetical protein
VCATEPPGGTTRFLSERHQREHPFALGGVLGAGAQVNRSHGLRGSPDVVPRGGHHAAGVSSYAVVWQVGGSGPLCGRLELDPYGLWLHGGVRGSAIRVEVPYDEITSVEPDTEAMIGPCRCVRINTRAAGSLLISTFGAATVLSEILDLVRAAAVVVPGA